MDTQIILSILWQMRQFRQRDHWTRQQLEAHQAGAFHSLRDDTYAHSPFYRRFHRGLTGAPLRELPVLTYERGADGTLRRTGDGSSHSPSGGIGTYGTPQRR